MRILTLNGVRRQRRKPENATASISDFAVITSHFNPCGYQSLKRNYDRFAAQLAAADIPLYTIELAFGDAPFSILSGPNVFQLRTNDVMWFKENLLNMAINRLPSHIRKIAWVDHDVEFSDPHWAQSAAQLLEQFKAIQLFSRVIDCDPDGRIVSSLAGVVKWIEHNRNVGFLDFSHCRPGFAWAARREFLEEVGLYDAQIVGSGDSWQASAWLRQPLHPIMQREVNAALRHDIDSYSLDARQFIRPSEIGYLDCLARHHWHGDAANRGYVERQKIIRPLNPETELGRRTDGLLCWTSATPEIMKKQMREYFTLRAEDSIRAPDSEIGLVTAADRSFFPSLLLWLEAAGRHWQGEILVFDLGLTPGQVQWCERQRIRIAKCEPALLGKSHAELVQEIGLVQLNTWWKPFMLDAAPFRKMVWVDCDALILTPLDDLLEHLADSAFTVYQEAYNAPWTRNKDISQLLPHAVKNDPFYTPNAGICAIDKRYRLKLLEYWKFAVTQALLDPELRQRISCFDQGALNWAMEALQLKSCLRSNDGWNTPANNLTLQQERASAGRKRYLPSPTLLDEITADHPGVHIVHWMGPRKLTDGWPVDLTDLPRVD